MAATYSTVRYKDTGDSVKALQSALNSAGYQLTVDGVFGKKTLNAVKNYQKANGLEVDGIVGGNTWGALNGPSQEASGSLMTATETPVGTGSGLSEALEKLIAQYNSTPAYTPKTAAEIRERAEGEYQSYYDQLELAAQQQQQRSDLALQQQREGLQAFYDKQRGQSAKEYAQSYSKADRQMLSRGMQRSSYGAQTLANISTQGAEAQQAIGDQQATAEANIDQQRTQLAQQLAAQLQQYSASEAADVLTRIRELEDKEYERGMDAIEYQNSLAGQLYQYMRQENQDSLSQQQWQQQFDESVRQFNTSQAKKSSSGGSGKAVPQAATPAATEAPSGMTWSQFMSSLGGENAQNSQNTTSGTSRTIAGAINSAASSTVKNVASTPVKKPPTTSGGGKPWSVQSK